MILEYNCENLKTAVAMRIKPLHELMELSAQHNRAAELAALRELLPWQPGRVYPFVDEAPTIGAPGTTGAGMVLRTLAPPVLGWELAFVGAAPDDEPTDCIAAFSRIAELVMPLHVPRRTAEWRRQLVQEMAIKGSSRLSPELVRALVLRISAQVWECDWPETNTVQKRNAQIADLCWGILRISLKTRLSRSDADALITFEKALTRALLHSGFTTEDERVAHAIQCAREDSWE